MNRKEIERLHEINALRDRKLITAKEYTTLRKELTCSSSVKKERVVGWAEVICVISPLLGVVYVLFTKKSGKKKFAILALSLIINTWVTTCKVVNSHEANTSNVPRSEQVIHKDNQDL